VSKSGRAGERESGRARERHRKPLSLANEESKTQRSDGAGPRAKGEGVAEHRQAVFSQRPEVMLREGLARTRIKYSLTSSHAREARDLIPRFGKSDRERERERETERERERERESERVRECASWREVGDENCGGPRRGILSLVPLTRSLAYKSPAGYAISSALSLLSLSVSQSRSMGGSVCWPGSCKRDGN
jgi:hypothetical protein